LVTLPLAGVFGAEATTSNFTVQLPFAGIVPPVKLALVAPAFAVTVPPTHVVDELGVGAMASPAGSASLNVALVSCTPLGLASVIVTVDGLPFPCRFAGANTFVPVMCRSAATVSVACAACALDPCDDVTAPAGIVLM